MAGPRGETVGVDPAAPRPGVGFRIHVPDAWLTLDLDPATSDGWVERVLDARIAEHPEAVRHRGHMRRILQSLLGQQRAAGVFLAAILAAGSRPADLVGASLSLTWSELTPLADVFHAVADAVARSLTFLDPAPAPRSGTIGYVPGG